MSEHVSSPTAPATRARLRIDPVFVFIAAAVFALDQLTKAIVRAKVAPDEAWPHHDWILNIINVSNKGAAFGILQGQTVFLVVTSIIGVAAIALYYMYPPLEHGLLRVALALQLGGAAGNLLDRIRTGEVTDFINFRYWPTFNVADSCISVGVATIFFFFLVLEGDRFRAKPPDGG